MIDVRRMELYFAGECTVSEFAEAMHGVMTDYVLMAAHAGCDADLATVARNIEFLEGVRRVMVESCREEE